MEDPDIWREDCLYFSDIKEVLVSDLGLNLSVCGYGQLSDSVSSSVRGDRERPPFSDYVLGAGPST